MPVRRSFCVPFVAAATLVIGLSCSSPSEPAEAAQILLSVANVSLDAIGATRAATPTVRDQRDKVMPNVTGIVWTTNNPAAATVTNAGLITATGNGTATITATFQTLSANVNVTVAQVPVAPVAVNGNFQSALISTALAQALQVRVEDRLGAPIAGVAVTFAVTSGGGSLGTTATVSDASGLAATTWTLGSNTALLQRVTASASAGGTTASTVFSATPLAGPPTQMIRAPGNTADGQIANISQPVPTRPAVEVRDAGGNAVVGATVTFTVSSGGGSVTGGAAVTDNAGVATVGSWTLGASPGPNTLEATLASLTPVVFTVGAVVDRCSREGAQPITLGVTVNGTISATDCPGSFTFEGMFFNYRYEYYRLDLTARTSLALEMSADFDTWLSVYNYGTEVLIAENDDIIRTINTDSRIGITLDSGTYLLRARGFDATQAGPYTLIARTALIGVPASVIATTPNGQVAAPGAATAVAPSVRVIDELGDPVAGVNVNFSTIGGIGSVSGGSVVTGANGVATSGPWTLAAGSNVVTATVSSANALVGNPVIYTAKGKASSAGFDIDLRFATVPTASQLTAFSAAAARWEAIITGDIPAQPINFDVGDCESPRALVETVDDVVIIVKLQPIDGAGSVLGRAGPCVLRAASSLPVLGMMEFDTADLAALEGAAGFGDVIVHEMGHVLGVGTIWSARGLLQNPSPTTGTGLDTHFSGANAVVAFNSVGGATYTGGARVPVENSQGGLGTRNSHWRESVLDRELMTGFYDGGVANPLSIITVQSMRDLGYTVDNAAADNFSFTASLRAEGEVGFKVFWLKDDVREGPIVVLDRNGNPVGAPVAEPSKRPKPTR